MAKSDGAAPASLVLSATVARRYYFDGVSKSDIATELGLSRFKVARLLGHARASGLVRIELDYRGEHYGQKDEEFLRLIDLPQRTPQRLELALSGADGEIRERLRRHGWAVRDAGVDVSTNLETYRSYILRSRGEFSVAKNAYVKTRSGWLSDRSVCYLAAGLPVVRDPARRTGAVETDLLKGDQAVVWEGWRAHGEAPSARGDPHRRSRGCTSRARS